VEPREAQTRDEVRDEKAHQQEQGDDGARGGNPLRREREVRKRGVRLDVGMTVHMAAVGEMEIATPAG
jgi:hypothetical protein